MNRQCPDLHCRSKAHVSVARALARAPFLTVGLLTLSRTTRIRTTLVNPNRRYSRNILAEETIIMKKLFILFALLITVASASLAQKTAPARETDEQWLTRFELQSAEALVKGDFSAVEKYISSDSVLTDPSGMMFTKAQTADLFKTGMLKFESSKFSEIKVRVFNQTTAVVTYLSEDKGIIKYADGKMQDISGKYRWTDTFVKMNGMWMCVATHGTPVMGM